jgi:opacity protein-like surface antigen
MCKILRALVVGIVLVLGLSAVAAAADAPDPVIGTWTLNLAKSKFSPGPAPKSQTRTYAETTDGTALSFSGVAADGSAVFGQSTYKYDGKDYPISGGAGYDALSLKRINGSTVKSAMKKSGKIVGWTTRTISAHGKVMTLATKATDDKGVAYDNVAVFDKQ